MADEKTYDPVLRRAMSEIVAVMKKYDCAGYVSLGSQSHFEFRVHFDSSWNLMKLDPHSDGAYRLRLKGELSPMRAKWANATSAFLYNLRDNLILQAKSLFDFTDALEKQADVTHNPKPPSNDDREMEDTV